MNRKTNVRFQVARHVSLMLLAAIALTSLLGPVANGQQDERKASTLQGTVKDVNTSAKRLSIENEPIPGGMGAMTMSYSVANEDEFARVKPGDHITAKMYEGDMTLYDLQVTPAPPAVAAQDTPNPGMGM
jgi:Cu/Ag efflux protein CusF